jgi:ureidoacrylate peracid hydrolase
LVIIDIVNGCCHENCEDLERGITFSKIRKMVPQLNSFIEEFREKIGGKVIFTNITPWTKEYLPENIQELYEDPATTYYSDGSKFEEDFYIVEPKKEDIIVTKNNYDTFSNPEFNKILKENEIKYLIISGVFTDGCVLATICGGFSHGYNFVILKDLIETTDVRIRQTLCKYLVDYTFPIMYGKTITSQEAINSWGK